MSWQEIIAFMLVIESKLSVSYVVVFMILQLNLDVVVRKICHNRARARSVVLPPLAVVQDLPKLE